jgi:hypothetical protein
LAGAEQAPEAQTGRPAQLGAIERDARHRLARGAARRIADEMERGERHP